MTADQSTAPLETPMPETETATAIAAEIRTAAAKLREMAKPAARGPWVAFRTLGPRQDDGHAWSITRPYCDAGAPDACEPDCGDTVLTVGAEGCEDDNVTEANAEWMAFASPLLAEPLAIWLEEYADWAARSIEHNEELNLLVHESEYCDGEIGKNCRCFDRALAVARVINGTTPVPLPLGEEA